MTQSNSNSHSAPKLWTKDFILSTIANFAIMFVFYLLMPTMALYAVKAFAANETSSGLASSAFIIGAVVARVLAGKFLDFVGRRRLVVLALCLYVIAALIYPFAHTVSLFIVIRAIHGFGFGASATALNASVMSTIPSQRRAEGTGYFGLATTIATAFGPMLALTIVKVASYNTLFYFSAIVGLIALAIAWFITFSERVPNAAERALLKDFRLSTFIDAKTLRIGSVILLGGFAYSGVLAFIASFCEQRNLGNAATYFFMVYAAAVFLSRLFAGRIQDRKGDNAVMYPSLVIFAAGFAVLAFAQSQVMVLLAAVFIGLGFGTSMPSGQAITIKLSPAHRIGLATSTYFLLLDFGTGFGPVVLGLLMHFMTFQGVYLLLCATMILSIVCYYFLHHRKEIA